MVELFDIKFPDRKIARNWYKGIENLYLLNIVSSHFTTIESRAFDSKPFQTLQILSFRENAPFEYKSKQFSGLRNLNLLQFVATPIYNIQSDIFSPIRRTILLLHINNQKAEHASSLNFNILFGSHKFLTLHYIAIENHSDLQTLAYQNFTGLKTVKTLSLKNCGIEVIMAKAFEYISVTLQQLNLVDNKLKAIPVTLLNSLMEWNAYAFSDVALNDNPWVCDCNLVEILHVLSGHLQTFGRHVNYKYNVWKSFSVDQMDMCQLMIDQCSNVQILHHKNICLNTTETNSYGFARFTLKLNKDRSYLLVNSSIPRRFRIWIADFEQNMKFSIKNPKCPRHNWLHSYTICLILNETAEIRLPQLDGHRLEYRKICLNYIAPNGLLRSWPLNCITFRQLSSGSIDFWPQYFSIVIGFAVIYGLICGIVLILILKLIQNHRNAKLDSKNLPKTTNSNEDLLTNIQMNETNKATEESVTFTCSEYYLNLLDENNDYATLDTFQEENNANI